MTEIEWNESTDIKALLRCLERNAQLTQRKIRLFAIACCRQAWRLFTDEHSRRAVVVAEWDVEGETNKEVLSIAARGVASTEGLGSRYPELEAPRRAAS